MASWIDTLKQRKIAQWLLAYLAGAWAVLQILDFLAGAFGWPAAVLRVVTVVVGVGVVAAVVLAWYHGERGHQRVTGPELLMLAALLVVAGALVAMVARPSDPGGASGDAAHPPDAGASIAVLPFEAMSGDPEDEYFGDGLAEELINDLARISGLRVAARTSSFAFREDQRPVGEIGGLLNVTHVVEGSVRRGADGSLRITAQLVDTRDGFHRWSRTWDRRVQDVFEIQEEISRSIVGELRAQLGSDDPEAELVGAGTQVYEAYDLYLRAVAELNRAAQPSLARAAELFERAFAADSTFAEALVGLAKTRMRQAIFYVEPDIAVPEALVAVNRALRLDPGLAEAYTTKAFLLTEYEWDWEEADRLFRRALDLAPGKAVPHQWYQNLLRDLGRCEEASRHGRESVRLDPLSATTVQDLAYTYYYCRDFDRAVRRFREAGQLDPANPVVIMRLGMALNEAGRVEEAIRTGRRAVQLSDRAPVTVAALARTLADAGRTAEARSLVEEVESVAATRYVDGVYISAPYSGLGELDRAIEWIERAHRARSPSLVSLLVHPWHDPLRSDPRFQAILERMRLSHPTSDARATPDSES